MRLTRANHGQHSRKYLHGSCHLGLNLLGLKFLKLNNLPHVLKAGNLLLNYDNIVPGRWVLTTEISVLLVHSKIKHLVNQVLLFEQTTAGVETVDFMTNPVILHS